LNVIGLAAELAAMEKATNDMRLSACHRIRKQVDRLGNMINELLEFTRGSPSSEVLAQTNFARFISQVVEDLKPEVADRNVEIVCENPPDVEMLLDPQRLTQVFINLMHNSLDAMPNGGKIFLRFKLMDREVITELEDTGKGFAPEIVPRLFEAFATFGKATGTGLGLSICRKIVTDHKGHMEAHHFPNRGAVFTFGLPIPKAQ
jgi:signal transduction histidine kinase